MTPRIFSLPALALACALAAGASPAAAAGSAFTLTPSLGPYVPATRLYFNLPTQTIIQLEPATMLGAAVTWRRSDRLAAEAAVGYGRGFMNLIGTSQIVNLDAAYVNTDALARWTLNRNVEPVRWELLLGLGAHHLRGSFADLVREAGSSGIHARTRLAVIAGLGASWRLGNGLAVRIDGEDHMHGGGMETDQATTGLAFSRSVQHDVSTTVGVTLPL